MYNHELSARKIHFSNIDFIKSDIEQYSCLQTRSNKLWSFTMEENGSSVHLITILQRLTRLYLSFSVCICVGYKVKGSLTSILELNTLLRMTSGTMWAVRTPFWYTSKLSFWPFFT
jgi:hypothetical protein